MPLSVTTDDIVTEQKRRHILSVMVEPWVRPRPINNSCHCCCCLSTGQSWSWRNGRWTSRGGNGKSRVTYVVRMMADAALAKCALYYCHIWQQQQQCNLLYSSYIRTEPAIGKTCLSVCCVSLSKQKKRKVVFLGINQLVNQFPYHTRSSTTTTVVCRASLLLFFKPVYLFVLVVFASLRGREF